MMIRCRLNPDRDPTIRRFTEQAAADLIDLYQAIPSSPDGEVKRLVALAQTAVEEASMWAAKAATAA
jgi:hypothetical protein